MKVSDSTVTEICHIVLLWLMELALTARNTLQNTCSEDSLDSEGNGHANWCMNVLVQFYLKVGSLMLAGSFRWGMCKWIAMEWNWRSVYCCIFVNQVRPSTAMCFEVTPLVQCPCPTLCLSSLCEKSRVGSARCLLAWHWGTLALLYMISFFFLFHADILTRDSWDSVQWCRTPCF